MYIIGISCFYHDASAALIKDGRLVAAADEERFTRRKHDFSFPVNAVNYCLEAAGIGIEEIDHITFYEKPILKFERLLYQHLETFPRSFKAFVTSMPGWFGEKIRIVKFIRKKLKYRKNVFFVEHHAAHAASAFLVSPFDRAAILTADGVGEWATTSCGLGEGTDIRLMKEIRFPHSLGLLYSAITAYLGFSVNNSEYKVMGLSAYGETDKRQNQYYDKLKKTIDIKADGSFRLDMKYFCYHYKERMPSAELERLLDGPVRKKETEVTQRHKDIAAALQLITEEVMLKILNHLYAITGCDNLVMAGGVALNSVLNGKILKNTRFNDIWIQPAASDSGGSLGAAFFVYNTILKNPRSFILNRSDWGPEYSDNVIEDFLKKNNIKYHKFENEEELIGQVAELIYRDKIVAWFRGRMEWGPRALGFRSILANPLNPDIKNILNKKVKHREIFRPFAPAVCYEDVDKYFECDLPVPAPAEYMLMVYPVKKEWRERLPGITHVNGSGRLQAVRKEQNKLYYRLIKKFGELSGVPILVNTSFNVRGEPIVCTPSDAYACFIGTEIDYLVLGNRLISKNFRDNRN